MMCATMKVKQVVHTVEHAQNPQGQRSQSGEQVEKFVGVKKHKIIKMKVQRERESDHPGEKPTTMDTSFFRDSRESVH